jgi:hypothetical protein
MLIWLAENRDSLAVALSLLGIALASYTFWSGRRARREDNLIRIHEQLLTPEVQEGRRRLFAAFDQGAVPLPDSQEYHQINRALAFYDTLGYYIQARLVDRKAALDLWHHPIRDIGEPADFFVEARASTHRSNWQPWPHLRKLIQQATAYETELDCCKGDQDAAPGE